MNIEKMILPIATDCWNALNETDAMKTRPKRIMETSNFKVSHAGRLLGNAKLIGKRVKYSTDETQYG